jgi:sugar lactone lactonase YvrE
MHNAIRLHCDCRTGHARQKRELGMKQRIGLMAVCMAALTFSIAPSLASPSWILADTYPDTGGRAPVAHGGKVLPPGSSPASVLAGCSGDIAKICAGRSGLYAARACLTENKARLSRRCVVDLAALPASSVPPCSRSPLCDNRLGPTREDLRRVLWSQSMGYHYAYPFDLPMGGGGATGVAIDSKGNVWVLQRTAPGQPQLFQFDRDYRLVRTVGDAVIGRLEKGHGIKVDPQDNVWISDANGAIVMKLSPQGKLLATLGVRGKRGDWDEATSQRLLWQPLDVAFAPNGDIYVAQGHGNESPNDVDLAPGNRIGAARILHLDRNGKFLNQWYGNQIGPGKFSMAHGIAVDPHNGDLWIGDREEYRLVVYSRDGKFLKTIQMRNLMCAVAFDAKGELWVSTGRDGQLLKLDRDGNVLGAVGNGSGIGIGQFIEATYMAWDKDGNIYSGDTSVGRVIKMVAPRQTPK